MRYFTLGKHCAFDKSRGSVSKKVTSSNFHKIDWDLRLAILPEKIIYSFAHKYKYNYIYDYKAN